MPIGSKNVRPPLPTRRKQPPFETCGASLNRRWTCGQDWCKRTVADLLSILAGFGHSLPKSAPKFSLPAMALAPVTLRKRGFAQAPRAQGRPGFRKTRGGGAFTLVEVMVALALLGICAAGCLSAIITNQVCDRKAKQEAIAMDFLTKYVENIKALPFASVAPGLPINSIYNGLGGASLIAIPTNNAWISLSTTAFQTFYPDLLWMGNLNPMMQATLTQNSVNGALHDIEISLIVEWNAPLSKGGELQVQVDLLRTVDVPTL